MKIVICVDDAGGYMFFGRRQSMDRVLRERLLSLIEDARLFMTAYTKKQFEDDQRIVVCDDPFACAAEGDYCFVENGPFSVDDSRIEGAVVFRWNRSYPADRFFSVDKIPSLSLQSSCEFPGYSHEKITMEVYAI